MRLVLVEWEDSFGCSSRWREIPDITLTPLRCRSVGWLLHDGEACKVIIPHLSANDHAHSLQQGCGDMTIPTRAVLRMVDLAETSDAASPQL